MKQLRKATIDDIPALSKVRSSVVENRLSDPSLIGPRDYAWFIKNTSIWLCELSGTVTGFSAADPRDGSIWALFVLPGKEGQGLGQALLESACSELRQAGWSVAKLSTDPDTRAEAFYRRNGWTETGRCSNGEVVFERRLEKA
ncbi:GNAT family N-acetyltransferase [Roseibium sp. SCP14]|uniref:GNAT family N-acetyltransferase n=1 Tax=Roseibium sp. SCP14 TaxID=3141375 RepID=UPI00333D6FF3